MNKNDQLFMAQKIRAQYTKKQSIELDTLHELDAKVKRPANIFPYVFGSIGAIVMGSGMSLIMTSDVAQMLGIHHDMGMIIGIVISILDGAIVSLV